MDRFRWFTLEPAPRSLLSIAEKMRKDRFSATSPIGFRLDEVRKEYIIGQFIERIEYVEDVLSPLGETIQTNRIEFPTVEFCVWSANPAIELRNTPRTSKSFFAFLSRYLEYSVAISPISIELSHWLAALEESVGPVTVDSIEVGDVPLSKTTHASMLIEGSEDVRSAANTLIGGRYSQAKRMQVTWTTSSAPVRCELTRTGARIEPSAALITLPALRTSLREALKHLRGK